jgi:SGNH domain-containing protein
VLLDLVASICPMQRCESHGDGVMAYRDSGHLSVSGAQRLVAECGELFVSVEGQCLLQRRL